MSYHRSEREKKFLKSICGNNLRRKCAILRELRSSRFVKQADIEFSSNLKTSGRVDYNLCDIRVWIEVERIASENNIVIQQNGRQGHQSRAVRVCRICW